MRAITGVIYSYYFLCQRKMWLFANEIQMEDQHENVAIGKLIDEATYPREEKHFMLDGIANIDFLKNDVVFEIKKSDAQLDMAINQVKYYIYLLRQKGLDISEGSINIPTKKITHSVIYEENDTIEIEHRLGEINRIISRPHPQKAIAMKACSHCAYYESCFI
ncbi:MAG: CRISPR-associated protein Cas4 [Bacillota bacterium]|nr:CRISPR-associated protein Cas4 [Bacillota bacterium]